MHAQMDRTCSDIKHIMLKSCAYVPVTGTDQPHMQGYMACNTETVPSCTYRSDCMNPGTHSVFLDFCMLTVKCLTHAWSSVCA